jgi:hypothetical protein
VATLNAADWPGLGNGLQGLKRGRSPEGKGHTFESCRVRQESACRACRDCGGSISLENVAYEGPFAHRVPPCANAMLFGKTRLFARRQYAVVSSNMEDRAVTEEVIPWTPIYCAN